MMGRVVASRTQPGANQLFIRLMAILRSRIRPFHSQS